MRREGMETLCLPARGDHPGGRGRPRARAHGATYRGRARRVPGRGDREAVAAPGPAHPPCHNTGTGITRPRVAHSPPAAHWLPRRLPDGHQGMGIHVLTASWATALCRGEVSHPDRGSLGEHRRPVPRPVLARRTCSREARWFVSPRVPGVRWHDHRREHSRPDDMSCNPTKTKKTGQLPLRDKGHRT